MKQRFRLSLPTLIVCGLVIVSAGCHSATPRAPHATEFSMVIPAETTASREERESLLAEVARLRMAAQESLDGAIMIGTPASQLIEASTALERAERYMQEREGASGDAEESLQPLRSAMHALQQAEEAAVHAGLRHIENELAAGYAQVLTPRFGERRRWLATVRVIRGVAYIRSGAGMDFEVVGKASAGDRLNLMGERGEWYQVRTQGGTEGWVAKNLVTHATSRGL